MPLSSDELIPSERKTPECGFIRTLYDTVVPCIVFSVSSCDDSVLVYSRMTSDHEMRRQCDNISADTESDLLIPVTTSNDLIVL